MEILLEPMSNKLLVVDLTGDEDPIDEDGDTGVGDLEVSVSLGEISLGGKKSQESNIVDLTGDEDPIDEDGDTGVGDLEVLVSLGEISLGGKKSQESNIGDTKDGGKTVGRAIIV
nr:hypothetical protein [Tanacetum cinerariifolium]